MEELKTFGHQPRRPLGPKIQADFYSTHPLNQPQPHTSAIHQPNTVFQDWGGVGRGMHPTCPNDFLSRDARRMDFCRELQHCVVGVIINVRIHVSLQRLQLFFRVRRKVRRVQVRVAFGFQRQRGCCLDGLPPHMESTLNTCFYLSVRPSRRNILDLASYN